MPIGKDSITKRVAKQEPAKESNIAPELVATTAAAPAEKKPAAKKTSYTAKKTASTTKKTTSTTKADSTAKKPAAKKPSPKAKTVTEKLTPPTAVDEKLVDTAVLANIAPETVAAVIGHEEKAPSEIVQIGGKLPTHLL